jgi:hypothetical protein
MSVDAATPPVPRPPAAIPIRAAAEAVTSAIRRAAQSTGASFDYLLATAKVESSLNPDLTMRSSSATGLFQFIEQTWLGVLKQGGRALGYARYADAITQTNTGRYVVGDPDLRREIMALRKDPTANALMGGVFTQQNAGVLSRRIGRAATDGELYIAHFFGPYGAAKLIKTARDNPTADAAAVFPGAARANRPIFYDRQGQARNMAGVYAELVRRYQVAAASPTPGLAVAEAAPAASGRLAFAPSIPASPPRAPAAVRGAPPAPPDPPRFIPPETAADAGGTLGFAAAAPRPSTGRSEADSVFHSMFQTENRRGAVTSFVAELWGAKAARVPAAEPQAPVAPAAPVPIGATGSPLDLFQDRRPDVRGLFDGRT